MARPGCQDPVTLALAQRPRGPRGRAPRDLCGAARCDCRTAGRADLPPVTSAGPQGEGGFPEGPAAAAGICDSQFLGPGFGPCALQLGWGEPSDPLEGAAGPALGASLGGVTYWPDLGRGAVSWPRRAVAKGKQYLAPFYGGQPVGPNVCFRVKRQA